MINFKRPNLTGFVLTHLAAILVAVIALGVSSDALAQSLGSLPPPPDLRTESEKSFSEKRKARKAREAELEADLRQKKQAQARAQKASQQQAAAMRRAAAQNPNSAAAAAYTASFQGDPNAITTASGSRLKAFGAPDTPDMGMPDLPPEPPLVSLPPMPDVRQEAEKSWVEKYREKKDGYKSRMRKLELARAEKAKADAAAALAAGVPQVQPDPSTALVKVQPEPVLYAYNGPQELPETPGGSKLKPFNPNSKYVEDNQLKSRGVVGESTGLQWIKKGVEPVSVTDEDKKWSWRNPFAASPGGSTQYEVSGIPTAGAGDGLEGGLAPGETGATAPDTALMSSLSGIILYPRTREVTTSGTRRVSGVINQGVLLPPKVQATLESYLGEPLSLNSLNAMVREAIVSYRDSDIPVVDVLVPEQEVSSGTLQLVVIEGRLGEVLVEGNEYTSKSYLRSQIRTAPGDVITESDLMEDIAWINKNPFRRVDLIYSPGIDYGTTDLILKTQDVRPITGYIAYENSGTEVLGEDRLLAGLNWAGPLFFNNDTIFSYQYSEGLGEASIVGHSGVMNALLPWRHSLTLLGAHVRSDLAIDVDGERLETGGTNKQGSLRYAIPLPTVGRITQEFEIGYDFKSSNSNLFFNTLEVFDSTSEISQFSLGYNITERDKWGTTNVDTELVLSPGEMTSNNTNSIFQEQRALADADYVYFRGAIDRNTPLKDDWKLITRAQGQVSNSNLLASETLGGGGYDTVRGFEQRVVRGDNGFLGSVELRTPPISMAQLTGFYNARDALVGLVFADYGYLTNVDKLPDEPGNFSLGSYGLGMRYQLDDNLTVRVDYGFQVAEDGFDDEKDGRFHIGARASF